MYIIHFFLNYRQRLHILQLSAVQTHGNFFNCYFKPEKGISPAAAKVTGLEFKNEKMFLDSRQVEFQRSITKVG